MPTKLHVLIVEDSEDDAQLILRELRRGGFEPVHRLVQTEADLRAALKTVHWEIILSDYSMPGFTGLDVVRVVREGGSDTPIIISSGTIGEAVAVECMKAGAADFFLKDKLGLLVPAIHRELREAESRWERQKAKAALEQAETRYRHLVERIPAVTYLAPIDHPEQALYVSPQIEGVLDYSIDEWERDPGLWKKSMHPEDRERVLAELSRCVADHKPFRAEYRMLAKGGRGVWVAHSGEVVVGSDRRPSQFLGFVHDITPRKEAEDKLLAVEKQLLQAQKMEAIGRLAGGVAHDFNNLLTVILGYAEFAIAQVADGKGADRADLEEIKNAGERAAALTRQLLAFSRLQVIQPRVVDLNALVTDLQKMLRRLIGEDIRYDAQLAPDLGRVKVDPGQIEQVVMNLVVNARDAMPGGGRLSIQTADVEIDENYSQAHAAAVTPGSHVMLAVTDTGTGMPQDVQARLFEPFFTTKEQGKGTGLGLSTVFGIVKQSGGHIGVYSEVGKGTTFKIYFPRVPQEADERRPTAVRTAPLKGRETILLVEDDPAIRKFAQEVLRQYGYTVAEAGDAEEALRACRERKGPIHLMLTDLVMPGLNGRELAEKAAELKPAMKVLYMSGYTDHSVLQQGVLHADMAFLQKPFSPVALARKVREVLDAAPRKGGT